MDVDIPYDLAPEYYDSEEEKEFSRLDDHYRKNNTNKIYFYSTNLDANTDTDEYDSIIHRACNPETNWTLEELIDLQTSLKKQYHNTRERLNLYKRDFSRLPNLFGNQEAQNPQKLNSPTLQNQDGSPSTNQGFPNANGSNNGWPSAEQLRLERLESRKELLSIENSSVLVKKDAKYLNRQTQNLSNPENQKSPADLERLERLERLQKEREKEREANAHLDNHVLVRQKCANESMTIENSHLPISVDLSFSKLQEYQNSLAQTTKSLIINPQANKDSGEDSVKYVPLLEQEIKAQISNGKTKNAQKNGKMKRNAKRKIPYPYPNQVQSYGKRFVKQLSAHEELQARTELSLLLIAAAAVDKQSFEAEVDDQRQKLRELANSTPTQPELEEK